MERAGAGEVPANAAPEVLTLTETVAHFIQLVDRSSGACVGIVFCHSEDDMRRTDAVLNAMFGSNGERADDC